MDVLHLIQLNTQERDMRKGFLESRVLKLIRLKNIRRNQVMGSCSNLYNKTTGTSDNSAYSQIQSYGFSGGLCFDSRYTTMNRNLYKVLAEIKEIEKIEIVKQSPLDYEEYIRENALKIGEYF